MDVPANTILIVTGAHLDAEVGDRPWAYWLRERLQETLALGGPGPDVVVCSDLWYLNHDDLRALPTISVGGPAVNALSAYLASRLPSVVAVEGVWVVLLEAQSPSPQACCWGRNGEATGAAVETFAERHLDAFIEALG